MERAAELALLEEYERVLKERERKQKEWEVQQQKAEETRRKQANRREGPFDATKGYPGEGHSEERIRIVLLALRCSIGELDNLVSGRLASCEEQ